MWSVRRRRAFISALVLCASTAIAGRDLRALAEDVWPESAQSVIQDSGFWAQVPSDAQSYATSLRHILEALVMVKDFAKNYNFESGRQQEAVIFEATKDMVDRAQEKALACKRAAEEFGSITPPPAFIRSHVSFAVVAERCQRVAESGETITRFFNANLTPQPGHQEVHSPAFEQLMKLMYESDRKASFQELEEMILDWAQSFQQDIDVTAGKRSGSKTAAEFFLGESLTPEQLRTLQRHPAVVRYLNRLRKIMSVTVALRDAAEQPVTSLGNALLRSNGERIDAGPTCRETQQWREKLIDHLGSVWPHLDAVDVPVAFTASHKKYLDMLEADAESEREKLESLRDGCEKLRTSANYIDEDIKAVFRGLYGSESDKKLNTMLDEYFSAVRNEIHGILDNAALHQNAD